MKNQPKGKAKAPGTARKSATSSGKTTTSRSKAKPVDSGQIYVVSGSVVNADSTPAVGLTIVCYDQDLRKKQLLGKAVTDAEGRYEISYTSRKFQLAEKDSADLHVVVVDAKGKELVSSGVIFNAPAETIINLTLPSDGKTLSEFDLLLDAILPLLAGQGKGDADLKITELEEKDIIFLNQESGQPSERIAFLLAAVKASVATGESAQTSIATHVIPSGVSKIPVEAFYGWFRKNLPADLNKLWRNLSRCCAPP